MKKLILMAALAAFAICASAQINQILGNWKTVDDKTGQSFSIINIYKASNGKYYGKIAKMLVDLPAGYEVCTKCVGEDANTPLEGLVIIRDMEEKDGELVGGRVLDPDNGKFYYGKIYLKNGDLVLRGSLDKKGLLGRSQTWKRAK